MTKSLRAYAWLAAIPIVACLLCSCSGQAAQPENVLNVYNWTDYIAPDVLTDFEKEYGITVNYDVFDSNEVLETKLLAGNTGYDVVVPSASFMQRQIIAGVFQKLDKSQLPNLKNMDPEIMKLIAPNDPGNQYAVDYFWGTDGVAYNEAMINAAMPGAPVNSFGMFYDPAVVKNFQSCGVTLLDAPDEVVGTVLLYLGRNPGSESLEDLKAVEQVLHSIRPYIRYINSSKYIEDLANGEVCLSLGWSGDAGIAAARAREAGKGITIKYQIPKEGSITFFDMLTIPSDALHVKNAHLFINFLMRPEIAARNSSLMHYAVSNEAAYPLVIPAVANDPGIYPDPETKKHLFPNVAHSQHFTRALNRMWTRFKTAK